MVFARNASASGCSPGLAQSPGFIGMVLQVLPMLTGRADGNDLAEWLSLAFGADSFTRGQRATSTGMLSGQGRADSEELDIERHSSEYPARSGTGMLPASARLRSYRALRLLNTCNH